MEALYGLRLQSSATKLVAITCNYLQIELPIFFLQENETNV